MTKEILALANAARAEVMNAEFLHDAVKAIQLPAKTIDVVVSNCVINLSADKAAVFAERAPTSSLTRFLLPEQRVERGDYGGCIADALSFAEYRAGLEAAGFTDVEIAPTHAVADGMHSAMSAPPNPPSSARPLLCLVRRATPAVVPSPAAYRSRGDGPVRHRE